MENELCQIVYKPTRDNDILDLTFVKESESVHKRVMI